MQYLVFSDIHLSEKLGLSGGNGKVQTADGPRRRSLVEQEACLDWIATCTAQASPDAVLFAGDLYDRSNPTPNEESVALQGIQAIADHAPTYMLLGNHTQSLGDDESALASLRAVRHPDVHVVESPQIIDLGGANLYCLPYPPLGRVVDQGGEGWSKEVRNGKVSDGLASITAHFADHCHRSERPGLLFSHVTFAGSEYGPGRAVPMTDVRVPTDRLPDFDAVVAGHLHMRQKIGGLGHAWYVGPPDRWSFNDEGNPAGIARLLVEQSGVKWQFRPYSEARTFETVTPDTMVDWHDHDRLPDETGGRFVRVRGQVDDLEAVDRLESIRDELGPMFGALTLDVEVPSDDREVSQVDPDGGLREIFDTFCNDRPDAIPEGRRESVFEAVQESVEAVGS